MKTKTQLSSLLLTASVMLVGATSHAATLYWDGGSVDIGTNGNGAATSASGTWNTSLLNWDIGVAPHVAWSSGDYAVIVGTGTGGSIAVGSGVVTSGIDFLGNNSIIDATSNGLAFTSGSNQLRLAANNWAATINGAITGSGSMNIQAVHSGTLGFNAPPTITLGGTSSGGWQGATTITRGIALNLRDDNQALKSTSGITLNGGMIQLTNSSATAIQSDRISDSAAITINGGGGIRIDNGNITDQTYSESIGAVTLNSGYSKFIFGGNLNALNSTQTLTMASLTRNGHSVFSFATGSIASIIVSNATQTGTGEIIGPWAISGNGNTDDDYAVFNSSKKIVNLNATANNDQTTWSTGWSATQNTRYSSTGFTLTGDRALNTLRISAAGTSSVGDFKLATYGILISSGISTINAGTNGFITIPTNNGNSALYLANGNSNNPVINAPIRDNGSTKLTLVLTGGNGFAMTLNGNSDYTGGTVIARSMVRNSASSGSGNLEIGHANAFGASTNYLKFHSGILDLNTFNVTVGEFSGEASSYITATTGQVDPLNDGRLTVGTGTTSASSTEFKGLITNGKIIKNGDGRLTLSGHNTAAAASAQYTVNSGTLQFGKIYSFFGNSTPLLTNTGNWTKARTIVNSGATLAFNVGGTEEFTATDINLIMTNLGGSNASGTEGFQAGSRLGLDTTNAVGGTFTQGNAIADSSGAGGGAIGLTKLGTGTLVLDKANTYTGATLVNGGMLRIGTSGSLANTVVTVGGALASNSPTLAGGGAIAGPTTIAAAGGGAAGTHSVGVSGVSNGVGTQTFTNGLTYGAGATFAWDIDTAGSAYDKVVANGSTLSGSGAVFKITSTTAFNTGFWSTDKSWTDIFSGTATGVGTWANMFSSISGANLTWDSGTSRANATGGGYFTISGSSLSWTAVPEPSTALGGLLLTAGLLRRRRRTDEG